MISCWIWWVVVIVVRCWGSLDLLVVVVERTWLVRSGLVFIGLVDLRLRRIILLIIWLRILLLLLWIIPSLRLKLLLVVTIIHILPGISEQLILKLLAFSLVTLNQKGIIVLLRYFVFYLLLVPRFLLLDLEVIWKL